MVFHDVRWRSLNCVYIGADLMLKLLKKWFWDIWFSKKEEVTFTKREVMFLSEEQMAFNKRLAKIKEEEE